MPNSEFCQCNIVHEDAVNRGKEGLIEERSSEQVAMLFKVFGDPTRIKILHLLSLDEMCVCDISTVLGMSQSAISHQLSSLRQAGLVKNRKDGKVVYYTLDDEHVLTILNQGLDHITHK
ncbi:MAG: winged helix-turn-helix transcriptional regulator [Clostridia bacterium]|nr:winged helix-turn-helix transcriptional regulator [Clostridia bacterium]